MKAFHPQSKSTIASDHQRRPSHRRSSVRPPAPPVANLLGNPQLQDMAHNRPQHQPPAPLQAKMSNSPRVQAWADLQSRMTNRPGAVAQRQPIGQRVGSPVQRQEALEDEEELQMRAASGPLQMQELEDEELMQGKFETAQRQGDLEEDDLLQGQFDTVQRQDLEDEELLQGKFGQSGVPTPSQESSAPAANRTGMPDGLKSGLEQLSGMDLSGIRVHRNSPKPSQLQALAYTQGQDIYMGPGQEKHLPHEGWHVVQQMQRRVKPTIQARGVSINDDTGLEHEADVMGNKALQAKLNDYPGTRTTTRVENKSVPFSAPSKSPEPFSPSNGSQVRFDDGSGLVQRYPDQDGTDRKDALIYAITTNDQKEIIYVGQTTDQRAGDRFLEHVKKDSWAPWWVDKPNVYGDDETTWPFRVHALENLKNVTKFETTVAEQWWLEFQLKEGHTLLNDSTPCSLANFNKRSGNASLYDPNNIGVSISWKPSMKAK
ncbi:MAG: DUF4157 domain-containing protein [Candidatus Tectomicrobia bacterium]|nr:DUF4157 domain-containing protein [Candidatus Tectomicrobia bacterium]